MPKLSIDSIEHELRFMKAGTIAEFVEEDQDIKLTREENEDNCIEAFTPAQSLTLGQHLRYQRQEYQQQFLQTLVSCILFFIKRCGEA